MAINKLLNSLGGTNFEDRSDKTHISEEESETWQAMLDNSAGLSAELAYKGQQVTGWENGDGTATELYSSNTGLQSTVNTDETTATFSTDKYTLTPAYKVSNSSIVSKYIKILTDTADGFHMKADGAKLYLFDNDNNTVYEYDLSTPFDIETATYDNKSFLISESISNKGLYIDETGVRMYIVGTSPYIIYQYVLSTPFDISTATYDSKSFDSTTEDIQPIKVSLNPTGTKMYVLGQWGQEIFEYTLSSAYDISSAVYSTFYHMPESSSLFRDFHFNSDGSKIYMSNTNPNPHISEYDLSTPYLVSSMSFNQLENVDSNNYFLYFTVSPTINKIFISSNYIYQYSLSTPEDISTLTQDILNFDLTSQDTVPYGMTFKPDGTKFYINGVTNTTIYQYSCSTPFDVTTATYDSKSFAVTQDTSTGGLYFKADGLTMFVAGPDTKKIYKYDLSIAFDITTAVYNLISFDVSTQSSFPINILFSDEGTRMYVNNPSGATFQYDLSIAFDITTAVYNGDGMGGTNDFMFINSTGEYVIYGDGTDIKKTNMTTAWDISTAVFANIDTLSVSSEGSIVGGIYFNPSGTKMFNVNTGNINMYDVGTFVLCDTNTLSIDSETKSFALYWNGDLASDVNANFELSDGVNITNYPVNRLTKKTQAIAIGDLTTITYVEIKQSFTASTTSSVDTPGWGISKIN